jgi:hypothetical protein
MTKPTIAPTTLLERFEGEVQTADGRSARVCRDPDGAYWVVDGAERVVPLAQFAAECRLAAQECAARARAEELRRLADLARGAIVRFARNLRRIGARPAHA